MTAKIDAIMQVDSVSTTTAVFFTSPCRLCFKGLWSKCHLPPRAPTACLLCDKSIEATWKHSFLISRKLERPALLLFKIWAIFKDSYCILTFTFLPCFPVHTVGICALKVNHNAECAWCHPRRTSRRGIPSQMLCLWKDPWPKPLSNLLASSPPSMS